MSKQIQDGIIQDAKITRSAMESELGDNYKRCWAVAFKNANEELDFDIQVENLCKEFDLLRPQSVWFVNGANSILFKKESQQDRQTDKEGDKPGKPGQKQLDDFPKNAKRVKVQPRYVSQLEMMSFLEDVEEMIIDQSFSGFWDELSEIKQTVIEQSCATEREVLKIFRIRSIVERANEENQRFFDAYPVSTDAWENGHFDIAGEILYN